MELVLHKAQEDVVRSQARFVAAVSGIRGGKTTLGAIWLLHEIDQHRTHGIHGDYLICAPTNKILEQATLPKFREFFPSDWGVWKEQKSYYELGWKRKGSQEPCRIFVRSMDEPDSIEGMDCLAVWADEVGKMKSQAWVNIQGRTSVHKGRVLMTTTPYNSGWFFRDVYKKGGVDKDYEVVVWRSTENPAFPQDEFERAKRTLPKAIFERRYEGKFTRLEGLVYPEFDEDFHLVEPFTVPKEWLKFGGLDFGRANPNAITFITEDPESHCFYVYKEFYRSETLLKTLSDVLHSEDMSYVLADTQSAQLIAELQQFYGNRNVREADKAIDVGIERIRSLLMDGRLKFFRGRTEKTIEEMEAYHYAVPDPDKVLSEKPVAKNNHLMDALRYAFSRPLQGLYGNRIKKKLLIPKRQLAYAADSWTGY